MAEAQTAAFAVREPAPAKLNLALHVGARRPDGYHALQSLIVFTGFGDLLSLRPADGLSLARTGPFAASLPENPADDLTLRAVTGLAAVLGRDGGRAISLEKNIPVAAGLGGGSADAAAAIRALCRTWDVDVTDPKVRDLAIDLGADVPVCLYGKPAWAEGVGEILTPIRDCPRLELLLVNPGVPLSTARVFGALAGEKIGTDAEPPGAADTESSGSFIDYLHRQRNDLATPAQVLCPVIVDVLEAIAAQPGCQLARMSGSGPTCFGVFPDRAACERAGLAVLEKAPGWWVQPTRTGDPG